MSVSDPTPEQSMSSDVPKQIAAYDDYVRSKGVGEPKIYDFKGSCPGEQRLSKMFD